MQIVGKKFDTVAELHQQLSANKTNEDEKVKAYFEWIIQNIKYDELALMGISRRKAQTDEEVLQRHKAICGEYSSLFKSLCDFDAIEVYVVNGYVRKRLQDQLTLTSPDHAWNILKLSGNWYQLDLTWAAGIAQAPEQHIGRSPLDYYLPAPKKFILTHLPSLPFWQLLDCPVPAPVFEHSRDSTVAWTQQKDSCFSFQEEIYTFNAYSDETKKLLEATKRFEFLPTEENKKEVAQQYIDMHANLFERSEELQFTDSLEELVAIQYEMYDLCEKASTFSTLFNNQSENCAYTEFNLAVSLFRYLNENDDAFSTDEKLKRYQEILSHLETSKSNLENLPQNILVENALAQLDDYIPFIKESITYLNGKR